MSLSQGIHWQDIPNRNLNVMKPITAALNSQSDHNQIDLVRGVTHSQIQRNETVWISILDNRPVIPLFDRVNGIERTIHRHTLMLVREKGVLWRTEKTEP